MQTNIALIVTVSDNLSESRLNAIEAAAGGTIAAYTDDGAGKMTLRIKLGTRPSKARQKQILEQVRPLVRTARLNEVRA